MMIDLTITAFAVILFFKLLPVILKFVGSLVAALYTAAKACVMCAVNLLVATCSFVYTVVYDVGYILLLIVGVISGIDREGYAHRHCRNEQRR